MPVLHQVSTDFKNPFTVRLVSIFANTLNFSLLIECVVILGCKMLMSEKLQQSGLAVVINEQNHKVV